MAEQTQVQAADQRLPIFLGALGWTPGSIISLTTDGGFRAMRFEHPSCPGGLLVVVLPPRGDMMALLHDMAGDRYRLQFVYRGLLSDQPPPRHVLIDEKLSQLKALLRGRRPEDSGTALAVAVPPDCVPATFVPWRAW